MEFLNNILPSLQENRIMLYVIIGTIVFFFLVMPILTRENFAEMTSTNGIPKIDTNICSRDCCLHAQWPVPHIPINKDIADKYIGSNMMCNNGGYGDVQGGCVCFTKDNFNYLANRGTNAGDPEKCAK